MAETGYILAIDQGTTSTRGLLFGTSGQLIELAQREFPQSYPEPGWVEQDPLTIWQDVLAVAREVLAKAPAPIAGIGIANQRETTLIWERTSGAPIYPAIVWQDRRTTKVCEELRKSGVEPLLRDRTGLLLDPYFSATKIAWILDHVADARARAEQGQLAFGTIDSFLLWHLTKGLVHATDATNAARTLLFNIHTQEWDDELLRLFKIPKNLLPKVEDNNHFFGVTAPGIFDRPLPIAGLAGDQHAAMVGQACLSEGLAKATYGTGCFLLLNRGESAPAPVNGILTTLAYRINGRPIYAAEGSIFVAGAVLKWLRDKLHFFDDVAQTAGLAGSLADNDGVYLVPAFAGLGAPHWDPLARGLICGLTLDNGPLQIIRAALESSAYQTRDLLAAMNADDKRLQMLRIDGGMAANDWFCQFLADILAVSIERPRGLEATALGAAFLAGLTLGLYPSCAAIAEAWQRGTRFEPSMDEPQRARLIAGWQEAVARTLTQAAHA